MQLTMFEPAEASPPPSSSGKTSPVFSPRKTTPSGAFWLGLPEKMSRFNRQGKNGRTLVVCMDPRGQSLGGPWTPNISDWPNDAAVCSLSQVLETGSIPQRYFLSGTACAGILRRAAQKKVQLPEALRQALEWQAAGGMGGDVSQTLDAVLAKSQAMPEKNRFPAVLQPIAFHATQDPISGDVVPALSGNALHGVTTPLGVRYLMPVEAERLQGFPSHHACVPYRGRPTKACPDGPRRKAIGNSMAVPCMRWIGSRIDAHIKGELNSPDEAFL